MNNTSEIIFLASAQKEAYQAEAYYENQQEGLGARCKEAVTDAVLSLSKFSSFEVKFDEIRRYNLKRFEYSLYYRVFEDQNLIQIEAVLHGRALFKSNRHS